MQFTFEEDTDNNLLIFIFSLKNVILKYTTSHGLTNYKSIQSKTITTDVH